MIRCWVATAAAIVLTCLAGQPAFTQDRLLRYGNTSGGYFDGRDDNRDFPTNGFFPGNFATDPSAAWIGAAGLFGSTPSHSATPYPSQVIFRSTRNQAACGRRYRSYDPSSGTFLGNDGARHPCG
ncbi:hypothetical protein Nham_3811 [Nitrobacter hamburgensis X14]|uniref:Lectin-like protein BA14k n=1 Tax=Nitrobacter hamburgensis (strain DSM 10229 / NCIMB 13809 / X14) TaxID=323097 RepID=Q1QGX6_NITHX|nr:BA14K family protein [Nitrobacter hamburgensis]ABE64521.1 hypothetical protein Nham_3811 [Nitrobacter hamburgensis X14]